MTASTVCPDQRDLERLALGQVLEAEAQRLGQHVLDCSACAERLGALQASDPLLFELTAVAGQEAINHLETPVADALVERLVHALRANADAATPTGSSTEIAGSPGEEPLPERLGRYRIVGRLGAGGMGVVCRGHDPQLRRDVAIKVPSFSGPADERTAARQRFLREARAAAAVRHPNVCPIYDVGEDGGRPYVVMALVEGESLAARLRRQGRFENADEAVALVARVADALAAVHAAAIVHRDLKPGNILLDRAGQPYLADFGLARVEGGEQLTCAGALIGTPAYLSPEQAALELGPVGPWSDQYSLGVVLYQLLTGRRPFEASSLSALIYQLGAKAAPPPSQYRPDLNSQLEAICLKALERTPAARFSSIGEFAGALERFLQRAGERAVGANKSTPAVGGASTEKARHSQDLSTGGEAPRLLLAARYYLEKRTEEGLRKSIAAYYRIFDVDPSSALAWAGVASAYRLLSAWGHASPRSVCPKAKSAALRAIELDGALGEAHTTLAAILMEYEWDLAQAQRAFLHALDLKPDHALAHQLYGKCLACMGDPTGAITSLRRAVELNPLSPSMSVSLGRHGFLLARRYDEAVEHFRQTLQSDPDFWLAHRFLGWAYLLQGDHAAALSAFETAQRLDDNSANLTGLGYAYAACGQTSKAQEALDALRELARHAYVSPDDYAIISIGLGDMDQAFAWLQKVAEDRSEWLCKVGVDPVLDPLRSDPRFHDLLRRVSGISEGHVSSDRYGRT